MEYLKIWVSFREVTECLADDEKGRLFDAMLAYAETGEEPELTGNERFVWPCARQNIRKAAEECGRLRANGRKGGRPRREAAGAEAESAERTGEAAAGQEAAVPVCEAEPECRTDDVQSDSQPDLFRSREDRAAVAASLSGPETDRRKPLRENGGKEDDVRGAAVYSFRPPVIPSPDRLTDKVQRELAGLTDTHRAALREYRNRLGDGLVEYAVDAAVAHGARSWAYVERILENYRRDGIRSAEQAQAADEKRRTRSGAHDALGRDGDFYDRRELELIREQYGRAAG